MPDLSPAAPAFQPRNNFTPTAPQIRQAYLSGQGRRSYGQPYLPRTSHGKSASFGLQRGRKGRYAGPLTSSSSSTMTNDTSLESEQKTDSWSGGAIIARPNVENQKAALELRALLEGKAEEQPSDPPAESSNLSIHTPSVSENPAQTTTRKDLDETVYPENGILSFAFEREYSSDWRQRDISRIANLNQEETWKNQNNHLLGQHVEHSSPPFQSQSLSASVQVKRESSISHSSTSHRSSRPPVEYLRLDGLGEGRSRNEFGRNLTGGQEIGHGVIGSSSTAQNNTTTIVMTEAGCDIPMVRESWYTQPRLPRADSEDSKTIHIGPHTISLNPDLPPLAVEHPGRVWNSMIHSLSTDLQPVVKWDYEKISADEPGQVTLWLAQLTLVLPPSHPAISEHPLYRTLPKNRWTKEYVSAVGVLGGIKRWVGEPKKLKADAQNTTLVKCISEDSLAWVLAPNGIRTVPKSDDEEEDNETIPCASKSQGHPLSKVNQTTGQLQYLHPDLRDHTLLSTAPLGSTLPTEDSQEIKIDEGDLAVLDSETINPATLDAQTAETSLDATAVGATPFQRFMGSLYSILGPGGLDLPNPASFGSNWEPFTNKFGYTLTVGVPGNCKLYEEPCIHTYPEEAQNAVCQKALELNVIDFMEWIRDTIPPSLHDSATSRNAPGTMIVKRPYNGNSILMPVVLNTGNKWQNKLNAFCARTGRQFPVFQEQVIVHEGIPESVSGVTLGHETFSVPNNNRNSQEVKEYLARRVLVDYFGEKVGRNTHLCCQKGSCSLLHNVTYTWTLSVV